MAKFEKGKSGNPKGKPKGAKDKRTELRALLQPYAGKLVKKAVDMALSGDTAALRLCIDRLIPPIKARETPISLPHVNDLVRQGKTILAELCASEITPSEASRLMQVLTGQARMVESGELEKRIAALETSFGNSHT